jgi:hypothetical protein
VIRKAVLEDLGALTLMLKDMMQELFPDDAVEYFDCYQNMILSHFKNRKDIIYIDNDFRGFLVVRDETEPCTPSRKIYNPMRIYVKPEYRKTRVLYEFYQRLFKDYPDGEIWGLTEIHSKHIPVLDKRHECVAKVYRLRRPEWALEQQ